MRMGPRNLITDVAGLRVGNAQDHSIKSGATVMIGDKPFTAGVHIMGGAPGTRETELLQPDRLVQEVDALVLAGGSAFGLDAGSGVADALRAAGRGFVVCDQRVPIVPGAILFDLVNGGDKNWRQNPYKSLGAAALDNADIDFLLGSHGAGTGATTKTLKGGLGSASAILDNGLTVAALVAVNALGSAVTGGGRHFWAAPFEIDDEFGGLGLDPNPAPPVGLEFTALASVGQNTTIAIVATDARLTQAQSTRMAVAAHDGMARALIPSHTPFDGDLIFAAATGEKPLSDPQIDVAELGHGAAITLSRAIARGVFMATKADHDVLPTWADGTAYTKGTRY